MGTSGRLSLSWVNKDRSLVSTQGGGYEWVDRDDVRVTETRLLTDVATVGETREERARARDNLLITGDSAEALRSLTRLPEFADEYRGKVKLVYIDPPFNTGLTFAHYDDGLEHSIWLTMMRDRLLLIRDLLADEGSLWLELDDTEMAYCKVLLDEIFGRSNFISTVLWQRRHSRSNDAVFSTSHDYILVYAKNAARFRAVRNKLPLQPEQASDYANPDGDPRGPWRSISFSAPNLRPNLSYEIVAPSGKVHVPPSGRCWRTTRDAFEKLLEDGRVYFGAGGLGVPRVKQFLSEAPGIVPNTWWTHQETGHTEEAAKESAALFGRAAAFSTPKPERLLHRIITIASDPGDIVLDCFAGSGTTAAVAHKTGRRWVTVERQPETVDAYVLPRLRKVVEGEDSGGVSATTGWEKGGGFRHLEVAPSMYERVAGRVLLAPWVEGAAFAAAACAQLPGFEPDPEAEPPFAGGKGRQRLAVVDGLVSESTVRSVVAALREDERVLIVAKSYLREAASLLERLSPGSRIKKAPQDLLDMKGRVLR
ncbi:site-specific DNA-methyltransferase [Streptomyces sp. KHY 26]|uniref:site-specific DNA-methyltransferase n=1 Tax=Streptomyces sp. KHY 26 TaxID=3097359 RepID=UPI00376F3251